MSQVNAPALIVRHDPAHTDDAIAETRRVLAAIGEPDALLQPTAVPGNLKVIPEGDPHDAQGAIARLEEAQPDLFRFTSRWTVVDTWVPSDLREIRRAVADYQRVIGPSDSWRVAVHPSQTDLHRQAVIDAVVPLIEGAAIDLEDPAKELRIDILGDETGVGLVDRHEHFRHPRG